MNSTIKFVLSALVAVVLALGAGWVWGRSGTSDLRQRSDAAEQRLPLVEALAATREGRIALFQVNFGDASGQFERAKTSLRRSLEQLQAAERTEAAAQVAQAIRLLDEAQQFANKLDQTANARAADAANAIEAAASQLR